MALLLPILLLAAATSPYDIVIRDGRIVDGTGSPWYAGDIGIRGGRVAAIGRLADAPGAASSTLAVWWWRRDSSTCWGNRNSRFW